MGNATYKIIDNTIFVGNLAFTTTDEELREIFTSSGRIVADAKIISNYKTGRSRGFGFVRMNTNEEADAAMELDGTECAGRKLTVGRGKHKTLRRR
ncbi:MAG: RNA recognition motif-containing protein [Planctomycetota bacterium]